MSFLAKRRQSRLSTAPHKSGFQWAVFFFVAFFSSEAPVWAHLHAKESSATAALDHLLDITGSSEPTRVSPGTENVRGYAPEG